MGGRIADDLILAGYLPGLIVRKEIFLPTDDGSLGTQGTVMALLPELLTEGL
jgi:dihydroorotate dehydrogenase electron transfer subunit